MLQVLLILLETRTSTVLYTDMNTDIGANINIAKKCTSLIQMESTSAFVCTHIFILILGKASRGASSDFFAIDDPLVVCGV